MYRILFLLPLFFALLIPNTVDAKKKKYPNGDYYEGEWKKGKPNGMGKMTYADGRIYEGNWKEGKYYDEGKMFYANGDIYEGFWENGKANGYGVMKYSNGGIYDGMWVDDMKMGRGKLEGANGERIEGEWKEDKLYKGKGNGYMDSNFYDGEWINGAFQGKCKLKFSNTTEGEQTFDGTIDENGIMEGTVKWANDIATYKGSLKNNKREGYGTLSFSKGNITIEGQWKADDIIQGEGKCIYVDNATYSFIINKYSTYIFTINKSNDTYNIKMETEKGNIACEQRKNCGIQSLCFEIINITSDLRRKDLEQAKKEHEQERELELAIKKQEQEKEQERERQEQEREKAIFLQKDIANVKYHYWTPSEIYRLYKENPAKFDKTFFGNVVGYATLIRAKITNIRRETEIGFLGDNIYYDIYLEGGVVIKTYKKSVVSQIRKGQTVFMLAQYMNETSYGYTQYPIFELMDDDFIENTFDALIRYFKEKRDAGDDFYFFSNFVRNIYR